VWLRVHSKFIIPRQLLRSPIAGVILKANMHRKLDAVDVSIRILASRCVKVGYRFRAANQRFLVEINWVVGCYGVVQNRKESQLGKAK